MSVTLLSNDNKCAHSLMKISLTIFETTGASTCAGTMCAAGKYGTPAATSLSAATCTDCPVGTYSNTTGAVNCTSCFDGWTTFGPGSTFCFPMKDCLPGTWRTTDDGSCIPCAPGTFSAVNNSASCTSCVVGKYSHVKGSSSCTPRCGPGFYSTTTGESTVFSGTCISCPRNFDAPDGSISLDNCTCAAGFFGPPGGPCSPCPTGTFKSWAGTASGCTKCPNAGQWSPTQSVSPDDCIVIPTINRTGEVQVPWYMYRLSQLQATWGSFEFAHCELNFTMQELRNRYKESRPPIFKTGGLGPLMQPHLYEVWVCIYDHYCSNHPTDKFFCWVLDETKAKNGEVAPDQYVPWNHNANLQIVEDP
jgi:hypothetical protein